MKRKMDTSFVMLKNHYGSEDDSIADIYQKYHSDPNTTIQKDTLIYYKVIQLYKIAFGAKTHSIVVLDAKMKLDLNDILIDNYGNHFKVKEFILYRISPSIFPRWYEKIMFVSVKGDISSMGDYLARMT